MINRIFCHSFDGVSSQYLFCGLTTFSYFIPCQCVYILLFKEETDSVKASDLDHSPYVNSVESWSHPWFDSKFSNLFSHFHLYSFFVSLYRWASLKSTSLYAIGIVWYCFHRYLSFSSFSEHHSRIFNCLQGFSIWMPFHHLISFNWHCLN